MVAAASLVPATPKLTSPAFSTERQRHKADGDGRLREREQRRQPQNDITRSDLQAVPEHVAAPTVDVEMAETSVQLEHDRASAMLVVPDIEIHRSAEKDPDLAASQWQTVGAGLTVIAHLGGRVGSVSRQGQRVKEHAAPR